MKFCEKLAKQRKNNNLSQEQLAEMLSVSRQAVSKWENGSSYPDMDKNRYWKSNGDLSWENGVFLSALSSWAEFDGNKEFIDWYESICERNRYQLSSNANRIYFADDLAVALMYAQLYMKRQDDDIIHSAVSRLEFIMNNPSPSGLYIDTPHAKDRWSWCDALYMAPPVFATFANITCNPQLREFMDREFENFPKKLHLQLNRNVYVLYPKTVRK